MALPLKPIIVEETFQLWSLDFIGLVNPTSSVGHTHILTTIDYFTQWVEAISVKHTTFGFMCDFIKENIVVHFGVPLKIVTDNATDFSSSEFTLFSYEYNISLSHSLDYYP